MVSFQCHACGDVVKKPKLDTHHGRCHSGFDCIDCHTTFNSPAEFKRHTSCITEAEKYQKGLYKGPKTEQDTPAPRNNYTNIPPSTTYLPAGGNYQNNNQSFGRGRGRGGGGYGANRNGSGWGRPQFQRNNATGANDTPLGTPTRVSPVSTPPPATSITNGQTNGAAKEVANKEDGAKPIMEETATKETKKDKKAKKRKSAEATTESAAEKGHEPPSKKLKVDPASIPLPSAEDDGEVAEKRKEKKSKERKEKDEEKSEKAEKKKRKSLVVDDSAIGETKEENEGKKEKKLAEVVDGTEERNDKSKKRKRDQVQDSPVEVDAPVKEKKKKKSKKDTDSTMEVDVVQETAVPQGQMKEKKKSKSHKKDRKAESASVDTPGTEKKSKREDKYVREKMKREKKRQAKAAGVPT